MKKLFSLIIVIILLTLNMSSALAASYSFDQIINIISACKIDKKQIFYDGYEIDYNPSKVLGPMLIWFYDDDSGALIFPKTNSRDGYAWNGVNKEYLGYCMDFLIPTFADYVDYDHGAIVTFRITRLSTGDSFIVLEYSPKLKNADNEAYGSTFSDANLFCQEVKRYAELINK